MRVPHIICENTIISYDVPSIYLRNEQLKGDDFTWDESFLKTLRELCLILLAQNWKTNPVYDAIKIQADKLQLLELISTDLPLELTVPIIEEDYYWHRCYTARWPDAPEPNRKLKYDKPINVPSTCSTPEYGGFPDSEDSTKQNNTNYSEHEVNVYSFSSYESQEIMPEPIETAIKPDPLPEKASLTTVIEKSWKQTFLQKFVEEEMERMKPDIYSAEFIKELVDLYGDYILCLNINELKSNKTEDSCDHVSLQSLLGRLPCIIEFSVCFNQANLGDEFKWHSTKISDSDCELLGKGVEKSKLRILRVLKTSIDSNKVKLLIRPLSSHKYLQTLDLSHCQISDEGAKALGGMLMTNNVLEKLILINNKIGPGGAQGLAYYLCQPESKLVELNLRLNPLKPEGGKLISTALARGAKSLLNLNMSTCGLTSENMHIGLALSLNTTLQKLDLSNNLLGEESAPNLLRAMENNTTIIYFNLKMCGLKPETVQEIQTTIRTNLTIFRQVLLTPPSAENIL